MNTNLLKGNAEKQIFIFLRSEDLPTFRKYHHLSRKKM